jgi:hypothetical protein
MKLTIKQLSKILSHTQHGTRYLLKSLSIPTEYYKGKYYFDTSQNHPFALSIRLYYTNQDLKVLYSLSDLSKQYHKNRKTILKLLIESDIHIIRSKKKIWVYLWDLKQFKDKFSQ